MHRRCNVGAFPQTRHPLADPASVPPDPTQLRAKAHFCDRHHIASAMAELVCCLSIIPHMRSFDVPPKLSPAHAGLFCAAKGGHAIGIVFGPLPFDALDRSGELRPAPRVLGPLAVLRRCHQKRPRRFVDQCFAPSRSTRPAAEAPQSCGPPCRASQRTSRPPHPGSRRPRSDGSPRG